MIIDLHLAKKFLEHRSGATSIRKVHSPFAYAFYASVLKDERRYFSFKAIEARRKELLQNHSAVKVTELGAGSKAQTRDERQISEVARHAAKRAKLGRLLFRMVNYFNPKYILELGTSLGISTAYLASARSRTQVTTLEGWPEILDIAQETFQKLQLKNINTIAGNFDDTLSTAIADIPSLDFVFLDGNHREEPTLRYFEECLSKVHDNSILIFDDIYWTPEMECAWEAIKEHPAVTMTMDIFYFGIVFFRKDIREKQHFKFIY